MSLSYNASYCRPIFITVGICIFKKIISLIEVFCALLVSRYRHNCNINDNIMKTTKELMLILILHNVVIQLMGKNLICQTFLLIEGIMSLSNSTQNDSFALAFLDTSTSFLASRNV